MSVVSEIVCFPRVEDGDATQDELDEFLLCDLEDLVPFRFVSRWDDRATVGGVQERHCSHVHSEGGIAWGPWPQHAEHKKKGRRCIAAGIRNETSQVQSLLGSTVCIICCWVVWFWIVRLLGSTVLLELPEKNCCRKVLAIKRHMHSKYYIQHSCDPAPMLLPRFSDFHNPSMSGASWGVWTSGRFGYWARNLMADLSSGRILALRSGSLLLWSWQGHATHTESHTAQFVREDGTPIFGEKLSAIKI